MLSPHLGHVDGLECFSHPAQGVVGVAPVLLRSEGEDVEAVLIIVKSELAAQRGRAREGQAKLVGELRRRHVVLALQIDFTYRGGGARVISGHELHGRASALGEMDLDGRSVTFDRGAQRAEPGEDLVDALAGAHATYDAVDVAFGDLGLLADVAFKRE